MVLTSSARLDPSCTYTEGLEITASDVDLNCRGAVLDRTGQGGNPGILVHTPADADMRNITIRNCVIKGFLNSIRISRDGFRALPAGQEYAHGISDVTLKRNKVSGSRGVGLYVDGYVTKTTIQNNEISGAGSSGIYLEAGSADNLVKRNWIHDNGFRENGPSGSNFSFAGGQFRFWGIGREGISVDGSRRNFISGNRLEGNSAGGVFLYTNCGEYVNSRPERYFQRRYGADDNVIADNHFEGGVNGVWVGSRMGESTLPMECSDPRYHQAGITWITLDRAAGNIVYGNSFHEVTYGVRVEDDRTKVLAQPLLGVRRHPPRGRHRDALPDVGARQASEEHGADRERLRDRREPRPLPLGRGRDGHGCRGQPGARAGGGDLPGQDAAARPVRHDDRVRGDPRGRAGARAAGRSQRTRRGRAAPVLMPGSYSSFAGPSRMPRSSTLRALLLAVFAIALVPASAMALPGAKISAKKSKMVKHVDYPGTQHLHYEYGPIQILPGPEQHRGAAQPQQAARCRASSRASRPTSSTRAARRCRAWTSSTCTTASG